MQLAFLSYTFACVRPSSFRMRFYGLVPVTFVVWSTSSFRPHKTGKQARAVPSHIHTANSSINSPFSRLASVGLLAHFGQLTVKIQFGQFNCSFCPPSSIDDTPVASTLPNVTQPHQSTPFSCFFRHIHEYVCDCRTHKCGIIIESSFTIQRRSLSAAMLNRSAHLSIWIAHFTFHIFNTIQRSVSFISFRSIGPEIIVLRRQCRSRLIARLI